MSLGNMKLFFIICCLALCSCEPDTTYWYGSDVYDEWRVWQADKKVIVEKRDGTVCVVGDTLATYWVCADGTVYKDRTLTGLRCGRKTVIQNVDTKWNSGKLSQYDTVMAKPDKYGYIEINSYNIEIDTK